MIHYEVSYIINGKACSYKVHAASPTLAWEKIKLLAGSTPIQLLGVKEI